MLTIGPQLAWLDAGSGRVTAISGAVPQAGFADATVGLASGTAERARLIDDTGRALTAEIDLPAGTLLYRGVRGGLLLRTGNGAWEIWDPADRAVTARFPQVIAASADRIAWLGHHRVRITSLAAGTAKTLPLNVPPTAGIDMAAFSPDGSRLAIAVARYSGTGAEVLSRTVTMADIGSGRLSAVPGAGFTATDLSARGRAAPQVVAEGFTPRRAPKKRWSEAAGWVGDGRVRSE